MMKKQIWLALAMAALILLCACQPPQPVEVPTETPAPEAPQATTAAPTSTPAPTLATGEREVRTFTDLTGEQVSYAFPLERIVSLQPATTEILYAIGAGPLVVGTDVFSHYPDDAKDTEKMGDHFGPDIDKIAAAKPDLVIAHSGIRPDHYDQLRSLGIPVALIAAQNYDDIYTSIELIGSALSGDYLLQAAALSNQILLRTGEIADMTAQYTHRPTVYFVLSYGLAGEWTSGADSFINQMIEYAGGTPVTNDAGERWPEYSIEMLAEKDPDILLVSSDVGPLEDLAQTKGYSGLTAVKKGQVYLIDADISTRPGPRITQALESIYETIKPLAK